MYLQFSQYQWTIIRQLKRRMITDDEVAYFKQGTFNSLCRSTAQRDAVVMRVEGGYTLSSAGLEMIDTYEHAIVTKSHASEQLGRYVAMLKIVRAA